ncbi:regulator of microtubule dynamics protein 1-like [Prorops nasuta]|uniref:regulator of microtubule dynamics protein 1-like n=1 Tax=Prorops nasuta TaxID=863751 RepID=UPI0034CE0DE1
MLLRNSWGQIKRLFKFQQKYHHLVVATLSTGRCKYFWYKSLPFNIQLTMMGVWTLISTKNEKNNNRDTLITRADALFDLDQYQQIYDLLKDYKDSKDVEILWRISRALYKMSQTKNSAEAKQLIEEAFNLLTEALEIQENHYAVHKWMSVILDSKSGFEGIKERIKQLYNVKQHMIRAMELNPTDATILYMIGNWAYQVSDLAWYQRKLVSTIFAEPPTSSFKEALKYFEEAEKLDPFFYSQNLLMLGKTYLKLNDKENAKKYLKLASEYPAKNDDDHKAKKESLKLLANI